MITTALLLTSLLFFPNVGSNSETSNVEVDAQQRATFETCMTELQASTTSLQYCPPLWAAPTASGVVTATTVTAQGDPAVDSVSETPAAANPSPATTTVPVASTEEVYDIPIRSDGEIVGNGNIPVDVGDCISERFAELGLTPTDPNFNSIWAAFVAANAESCRLEHA